MFRNLLSFVLVTSIASSSIGCDDRLEAMSKDSINSNTVKPVERKNVESTESDSNSTPYNGTVGKFDFNNFSYPICPNSLRTTVPKLKRIRMLDGQMSVEKGDFGSVEPTLSFDITNVTSADVTRDGSPEAIVTITTSYFKGQDTCTFVYSTSGDEPRLLWKYEFSNGLRKLWWDNQGLWLDEYENSGPYCCPANHKENLFVWNGSTFKLKNSMTSPNDTETRIWPQFPK